MPPRKKVELPKSNATPIVKGAFILLGLPRSAGVYEVSLCVADTLDEAVTLALAQGELGVKYTEEDLVVIYPDARPVTINHSVSFGKALEKGEESA